MNKNLFLTLLSFTVIAKISAQKLNGIWQFNITPTLSNRIISYKGNFTSQYKDSIKRADTWRKSISAAIGYNIILSKKTRLTIGLQYQNFGFKRVKENLKFRDTIHPEIGRVNDLSQTGSNSVEFNYRYHYLAVPVLLNYQIHANKTKTTTIHWIVGGSIAGLLKHDIRAVLRGFSAYGEKVFILKNKPEQPALLNLNFHTGMRLENLIYGKNTWIFVQPMLYAPVLNANYGSERHHLFSFGLEIGLAFKLDKEKAKM